MEIKVLLLFLCVTTVATVAIRSRNKVTRMLSTMSAVCFSAMLYVGFKNYPNTVQGMDLDIMGFGAILGLAFALGSIVMYLISTSKG